MPTPLTLAEFKAHLADRAARDKLGVSLTDQQALHVLADDQKLAELYVNWRTAPQAPQPAAEPTASAPLAATSFWRRPATWVIGGALAIALIVGGVFVGGSMVESQRKQEFAQLLRDDPDVSDNLRQLEGESLDAVFSTECDKVRDGWSEQDQEAANANNWPGVSASSEVTQEQYIANTMAMFRAAVAVCG